MEVSDDFGLILLIKRHGGRCALLSGVDALSLDWYRSGRDGAADAEELLRHHRALPTFHGHTTARS
jgi:hypothetical protein